jgi:hypothetical protein
MHVSLFRGYSSRCALWIRLGHGGCDCLLGETVRCASIETQGTNSAPPRGASQRLYPARVEIASAGSQRGARTSMKPGAGAPNFCSLGFRLGQSKMRILHFVQVGVLIGWRFVPQGREFGCGALGVGKCARAERRGSRPRARHRRERIYLRSPQSSFAWAVSAVYIRLLQCFYGERRLKAKEISFARGLAQDDHPLPGGRFTT